MIDVHIIIDGLETEFDDYREITRILARKDNPETSLIAWSDTLRDTHSPSCIKCSIGGEQGWEVYGRNHGGRLRFSVDRDRYVFIYG